MSQATTASVPGSQRLLQALSALRHRNYRLYWFGQLASVLAQNMEGVAQSWLVLEITNSPLLLGLTGLTFAAPTILLSLLGGVIADRADRRRIMILSQSASALNFLIIGTLVATESIAQWHVMMLAFVSGCVRAFDRPSHWACLRPMTPDGPPIIGGTRYQNLWINTGQGHMGWTMACGSGRIIADLIQGKKPDIEISGFSPERY